MSLFIGLDTSNYMTSAALYDSDSGEMKSSRRLLDVKPGQLGLRQSETLFLHIQRLPDIFSEIVPEGGFKNIAAVAASTRPRAVDGSYMPCFLAGAGTARMLAESMGVEFYRLSHQQGHIAAAAWSAERPELMDVPHIGMHLSGGTTEILYITPGENSVPDCVRIGGSTDIAVGQVVDRCGQRLGLKFPSGKELDKLSLETGKVNGFLPKPGKNAKPGEFSLSGLENKIDNLCESGTEPAVVARFVLESIIGVLERALKEVFSIYGNLPLVCAGGVASNTLVRKALINDFGAVFALPEYASDNAAGIAYLAERRYTSGEKI